MKSKKKSQKRSGSVATNNQTTYLSLWNKVRTKRSLILGLFLLSVLPLVGLSFGAYMILRDSALIKQGGFETHISEEQVSTNDVGTLTVYGRMEFFFDEEFGEDYLIVELSGFNFSPKSEETRKPDLCVRNIYGSQIGSHMTIQGVTRYMFQPTEPRYQTEQLCQTRWTNPEDWKPVNIIKDDGPIPVSYLHPRLPLYYPFDVRRSEFFVWADAYQNDNDLIEVVPQLHLASMMREWSETVTFQEKQIEVNDTIRKALYVDVTFQRPISVRIFTSLMITALFLFITLLLFVRDNGSALEVSLAILLGLWGVKDLIRGPDQYSMILIDTIFFMLYIYFAIIVFLRFSTLPLYKKLRFQNGTDSLADQ